MSLGLGGNTQEALERFDPPMVRRASCCIVLVPQHPEKVLLRQSLNGAGPVNIKRFPPRQRYLLLTGGLLPANSSIRGPCQQWHNRL